MKYFFFVLLLSISVHADLAVTASRNTQQIVPPIVENITDDRVATVNLNVVGKEPMHVITAGIDDIQYVENVGLQIKFYYDHYSKFVSVFLPYKPTPGDDFENDFSVWFADAALQSKKPVVNLVVKNGVKWQRCVIPKNYDAPDGSNVVTCTIDRRSGLYPLALYSLQSMSPNPKEAFQKFIRAGFYGPENPFQ